MKFTYIDKETLCVYEDGKTLRMECAHIAQYREASTRDRKNKEWKKNSDAMLYEGVFNRDEAVVASVNSLSPTADQDRLVYSFSVNESSGVYFKFTDDEKKTEAHAVSSNEVTFSDVVVNGAGEIAGTVQQSELTSSIAVFSRDGSDYKCLTGGDSKDENPFFGEDGVLYFNSYGVGRDANNEFVTYAPSEILKLNTRSMEIETVLSDGKYSFIKPVLDGEGNLYCIRKPSKEKESGNPLLNILLIPVRIVEGIAGFVSFFVKIFAGKNLVDNKGRTNSGGGAARNADGKKIFLHNHLLNVEKELERNKKEADGGFIPRGWKLIVIPKNNDDFEARYIPGTAVELASGVADFCLIEENGERNIVYTNGKRIFLRKENGEKTKLVATDFCLKVGALQTCTKNSDDLFDSL